VSALDLALTLTIAALLLIIGLLAALLVRFRRDQRAGYAPGHAARGRRGRPGGRGGDHR
jgi:predicted histidine transporter YuiF (NhaC family)